MEELKELFKRNINNLAEVEKALGHKKGWLNKCKFMTVDDFIALSKTAFDVDPVSDFINKAKFMEGERHKEELNKQRDKLLDELKKIEDELKE